MNFRRLHPDLIGGFLVFLTAFAVFLFSPVRHIEDSRFSMFLSEHLLSHRSFSFDRRAFPSIPPKEDGEILAQGKNIPYQLELVSGKFYYWYPPGTSILSMPYIAAMNAIGVSATDRNGVYDEKGETTLQAGLAALLMAGLALITFCTSRLLLSFGWGVLIALATAFGTQIWSTASRGMWSDTWGVFILSFVIWQLLRAETKQIRHRPLLLATCLSWLYFLRPTSSIPIIAITVYVFLYHRSVFLSFALTGCLWLAAFVSYSQHYFGQSLPSYYRAYQFTFATFWEGMAGTLISPSRGLLIYVPVVAFVVYLLLRYWSSCILQRFAILGAVVVIVHLVLIFGYAAWHGGHSYGPRYTTAIVPWFALLGILAVKARLEWRDANPRKDSTVRWRAEWSLGAVLLLVSITFNGVGGISPHSIWWNGFPANVDTNHERLWDWKDPQFFRPLQPEKSFVRRATDLP